MVDTYRYACIVTDMLWDERPQIARTSRRLMMKYRRVDFAVVKAVLEETPFEITQRRCVWLLHAAPNKWARLIYIMEAVASENAVTKHTAERYVSRWHKTLINRMCYLRQGKRNGSRCCLREMKSRWHLIL